jgi:hypothetical protein
VPISSATPCRVFPPEWVAKLKAKYQGRSRQIYPKNYFLFTADELQPDRDQIERWVDLLPEKKHANLIGRLREPDLLNEAFNELAVGDSLRRMGHEVEYEPEIGALTPDWFVRPRNSTQPFIVEVVSSQPPKERERRDDGWERLRLRFQEELTGNSHISVQPPFSFEDGFADLPSEKQQKGIVRKIQEWINSDPPEGAQVSVNDIEFHFVGTRHDATGVYCGMGITPFTVDVSSLRRSVRVKASKYKLVGEEHHLPFLVTVILDFSTGRDIRDLKEVAFGTEGRRIVTSRGGAKRFEYFRDADGLFARYPTLSAVSLAERKGLTMVHTVLRNQLAKYSLGDNAFPVNADAT